MGQFEFLRKLQSAIGAIGLVIVTIALLVLLGGFSAHLRGVSFLILSSLVKAWGLPQQIHHIVKSRSVEGLTLSNNLLNYLSYVAGWVYASSVHDPSVLWAMAPGAVLVGIVTLLHLQYGSFAWRRLPNAFGHYPGTSKCKACRSVSVVSNDMAQGHPSGNWKVTYHGASVEHRQSLWRMPHCRVEACRGGLHLVEVAPVHDIEVLIMCDGPAAHRVVLSNPVDESLAEFLENLCKRWTLPIRTKRGLRAKRELAKSYADQA